MHNKTQPQKHRSYSYPNMGIIVIFTLVTLLFLLALKNSSYSKSLFNANKGHCIAKSFTSR